MISSVEEEQNGKERKERKEKGKKERKERKEKERKIQHPVGLRRLNVEGLVDQGVSSSTLQEVGALSYSGYSLSKGHSMAMRYSSNCGTGSRTILIKLLII